MAKFVQNLGQASKLASYIAPFCIPLSFSLLYFLPPPLDKPHPAGYSNGIKYELHSTPDFNKWLNRLKDATVCQKVLAGLARVENDNFGDYKQLAADLFELRFFFGGGLRIYYTIRGSLVVLLLVGVTNRPSLMILKSWNNFTESGKKKE